MAKFNIVIAGGREFNDYKFLKARMDHLCRNLAAKGVEPVVVSGKARGADSLGEQWAKEHGYGVIAKPADWDTYGKSAGYKRNEEMALIADAVVCFWDNKSKGTKHMIELAKKHRKIIYVYPY